MLTILLVPVLKDKTSKISSIENCLSKYIISNVFERILMETTYNQFGFKRKHGTVSKYNGHNSTVFMCFLDAPKAFDRINHIKLFIKLQDRGVPHI